jgi:hypothetical protein
VSLRIGDVVVDPALEVEDLSECVGEALAEVAGFVEEKVMRTLDLN